MRFASTQGRDRGPECDIDGRCHVLARSAVLEAQVMTHSIPGGAQMTTTHPTIHTISLGPRTRRAVRSIARFVNPVVLQIAGRRWMPILGVLHHRGRQSGRTYSTPLGMRRLGDHFVMPRTFGENAAWYLNGLAAGGAGGPHVRT